jgi:hypothetical protein
MKFFNAFRSRKFFTVWFGLGIPPFLFGTVAVAFMQNLWFGVVAALVTIAWAFETFATTCRRCAFYGSAKCGAPGLLVPLIFEKKHPRSISLFRVRIHFYADILMILFVNLVYRNVPVLFPLVATGSAIGWFLVFSPKKYHGLLYRLNEKESTTHRIVFRDLRKTRINLEMPNSPITVVDHGRAKEVSPSN